MKDKFGKELKIGDKVVFAAKSYGSVTLGHGVVTKIFDNKNVPECTVNSTPHIYSNRVAKMDY